MYFEVSAEYVRQWELDWLYAFNEWSMSTLELYGVTDAPPSSRRYTHCSLCNNKHKYFSDATEEQIQKIAGCTISPILARTEKL